MRRLHGTSVVVGALVGVVVTAATLAYAQVPVTPHPATAVSVGAEAPASLQALSPDTFVSVKDHGASQTVIVYKLDEKGQARLTHKAKFFY